MGEVAYIHIQQIHNDVHEHLPQNLNSLTLGSGTHSLRDETGKPHWGRVVSQHYIIGLIPQVLLPIDCLKCAC